MSEEFLISLSLISLIIVLIYVYLAKRRIVLPNKNGEVELRPTLWPLIGGLMLLVLYTYFTYFVLTKSHISGLNTILYCSLSIPVLILSAYNLLFFLRHKLVFNTERIKMIDWKGKPTEISWSEIENIKRGLPLPRLIPFTLNLIVNANTYKIDPNLAGFKTFEYYLEKYNSDMGLLMNWRSKHNPEGGNNYL